MKYDAVILDVDGTLWDSTPVVADVWTRAVRESGFPGWSITGDGLKQYFGNTMDVIAAEMLPEATKEQQLSVMEKCCAYEHEGLEATDLDLCYPLVRETIKSLSQKLPVAIVSNCQAGYIECFLAYYGIPYGKEEDLIEDIECFGNNGLQKDENIRLLAKRNSLTDACYVGDIQGDCDASMRAGVDFIHAAYGFGKIVQEVPRLNNQPCK